MSHAALAARLHIGRPLGSMPTSGEVVDLDFGAPEGREIGFRHPAVLVTAQRILDTGPMVVQVAPLTSTLRSFHSEVTSSPTGRTLP